MPKKKDIFAAAALSNKFICFSLCKFLLTWANGTGHDLAIFVACVHLHPLVNWFYYFFLTGKFLSLLSFNPKKFFLNIHYWLKYDHINTLIANYQKRDIRKSRRTQEAIYLLNNSFERLTVSNRTYIRR